MTIAFLYSSFPKWSETFLRQDLALLLEQGLPIHAISLFSGDCEPQADWPKAEVLQKTNIPSVSAKPSPSKRLSFLPKQFRAWLSLLKHRKLLDALCLRLKQLEIKHIHAEFADLPALLAAKAAKRLNISYSVGIHAFDVHCAKYPAATIFGDACFITACNQAAADALSAANPSLKSKIAVIHHGIDLQKWTFDDCQPPKPICKIAFVGRLVPKKGLDILIQTLPFLKNAGMDFHLDVVGSGPLENELKDFARQQKVEDFIHWHGVQPPKGVRSILRQSSCLCAPSVIASDGDRDGIPNTVLEAMSIGLPVITTQVGGLKEAMTDDRGWIIDFLSSLQLSNTLTTFAATSPEERQRRIQNARQLIESDFDARKLAKQRANLFLNGKL
jgi:glycosyltransferase involved in cell wall biosynthesis